MVPPQEIGRTMSGEVEYRNDSAPSRCSSAKRAGSARAPLPKLRRLCLVYRPRGTGAPQALHPKRKRRTPLLIGYLLAHLAPVCRSLWVRCNSTKQPV